MNTPAPDAPAPAQPGGPSRLFILRPVATTLLMVAILLAGLVAYRMLPLSALPEVDYPTIQVTTLYPGASPDVMALTVTSPLERQFGQMPGLTRMTSASSAGASVITMQFRLDLSLDIAEQEVQAAINAANTLLPTDLPAPPIYAKVNPADAPILSLGITSKSRPLGEVQGIVERQFSNKISQVSGVGLVSMSGGQRPAVRIQANVPALAARGLSLESIRSAIANANANAAKGSFDGPTKSWTIDANDQLSDVASYRSLVVAFANGAPVRLSDVANVVQATENTRLASWMNGQPAVVLDVQRQPGANVIGTVDAIKASLPELEAQLPADVHVTLLTDRTAGIRSSVADVRMELVLAVVLVTLVIFLFLGSLRATVVASIAVPLSLVGAFAAMYFLNFSINNLTLMALTIASGFVVDDAIVVLENIARHIELGMKPFEAALKGASEIGFTIISLTVSLIAVLIPLLFMGDVVGRLFREFAVTLAVTILISALVALTLVPMLSARWLKPEHEERQYRITRATRGWFDNLATRYVSALDWVMARSGLTMAVFAATLVITGVLFWVIPKDLFPEQDTGQIAVTTVAGQDIGYTRMSALQQQVAQALLADPAVDSLSSSVGVDGQNPTLSQGRMVVNLKSESDRGNLSSVIDSLTQATSGIVGVKTYFRPVQDLTIDTSTGVNAYRFSLQGADEDLVNQWGEKLAGALKNDAHLQNVTSNVMGGGQAVTVDINRDIAGRLGLSVLTIDNALYDAFGQRIVSTIYTQSSQNRVILEAQPGSVTSPQALGELRIPLSNGTTVPLSTVAAIHTGPTALVVSREAQFPAATIGFDLAPGVSLGKAVSVIERAEQTIGMPAAITTNFSGAASAFKSSLSNELWLILAAIVVVYIVLGVLYESFVHPITILSTLPSAGIGALLGLWLTGSGLGVIGIIGIVLLIGIVKKNAIMMIDFALEAMREEGADPDHAIRQAAHLRFRPIMMTTFAALFAALPLIFGGGMGHELRQPLGIAIAGGLIFSQVLTLFTTPVIFLGLERWRERREKHRANPAPRPA
ncbi:MULTISPECIES: efflux RND transporter permease subunit [unclassified Novosphingobium]|uniref:efflux RND transporter permease subunit n=1 Tax=unclassified Novosphingobium TaxID=2644732 RepID=UPI001444D791|nr:MULTISPECIES: efflux RND transporter permease subunit [unclassified Novosphingobium]NKJ44676.1 multidrug efflux pump [Novosphingobium sp. SG720]NMN06559.1 multidrug efflux pump [Novosphingobium sp. SG919]NMN88991.1 multidrug efflux pump [Novosphingobium sp. SG916]